MLFGQIQKTNKHLTTRTNPKESLSPACLGLASILLVAVFMSGCVVHHNGHGYKKGHKHGHGHGHHKGKVKIVPKAEISVSPLIVVDD